MQEKALPLRFQYSSTPVLIPMNGCLWADTMVLNPALVKDPESSRLHMLFRATGPWPEKQIPGKPLPYPIFLGYAFSDDNGLTWAADFSRPALAPALKSNPNEIYVLNVEGRRMIDYSNGCIEDPRLFWLEGKLYLSVACRMFPPGPYWERDEPTQCCPEWTREKSHPFGRAARENVTTTVLYQVDLDRLKARDYSRAFGYVTHLTDPEISDNRDAFLFPEKMVIAGRSQYVGVHRPKEPQNFPGGKTGTAPSIFLTAAERLEDIPTAKATHSLLAEPCFDWEGNRIGGSWSPLKIGGDEWLLGYHGKKDDVIGYTQSFMILKQEKDRFPTVLHRCPERLMFARQAWELAGRFTVPCMFTCSGIVVEDTLIMGYGAADEKIGIARVGFQELIAYLRQFDAGGKKTK
jgi:beta-1,2-mannobiose phosphorylase / 1,2-beta-oligomannan phosphorylase